MMRNVPSDSQASLAAKAEEVTDYFVPDHFSTEIAGRTEYIRAYGMLWHADIFPDDIMLY